MPRTIRRALCVSLLTASAVPACKAGGVAEKIRPTDPSASEVLGEGSCQGVAAGAEPLVVDWKPEARADLEERQAQHLGVEVERVVLDVPLDEQQAVVISESIFPIARVVGVAVALVGDVEAAVQPEVARQRDAAVPVRARGRGRGAGGGEGEQERECRPGRGAGSARVHQRRGRRPAGS